MLPPPFPALRRALTVSILALLPVLPARSPAQVVELNPVELSGTVRIGDYRIRILTVRAISTVGTSTVQLEPDAVEASYTTIVQVPAGGSAAYRLNVSANLLSPDGSQAAAFGYDKPAGVLVLDGEPATLDLVLDPPSFVRGTVTALPGELIESVSLFAQRWDSGGFASFNTLKDAPPGGADTLTLDLPVAPGVLLRCFGGANMTNGRSAELEPFQLVTVPDGGVGECDFTVAEPPVLGSIRGAVDLAGDVPVDEYRVIANAVGGGQGPPDQVLVPPFPGPGNRAEYEFTDVQEGDYDVSVQASSNDGDDQLVLGLAERAGVSGAVTVIADGSFCQAAIDTGFVFGGLTAPEDWVFAERPMGLTRLGDGIGASRPRADPTDGPFRALVTEGSWRQSLSFAIRRDRFEPGGFANTSTAGAGFRYEEPIPVACFESASTPDRVLETGRVEVRFQVADGSFLQDPLIRATCAYEGGTGAPVYRYETLSTSATPGASVAVGVVPVEAPAGLCDFVATARVGGVTVSFGSLNDVEIVSGVDVVIGLGGPRILLTSPAPGTSVDADEILVTGTATDDGEIVSVVVNGVEASLSSTGNPADPNEVAFSATVPLASGPNRITAVATDDDANATEASLTVENSAPPPPDVAPDIVITSPAPGASVDAAEVLVEGTARDDGAIVRVVVGGVEATLAPTGNPQDPSEVAFAALVPLAPGANTLTAIAVDDGGNESEASVDVESVPPPPDVLCDADGDGGVDRDDIAEIFAARGEAAAGPDDPRDANGDGWITVNDGRLCVFECTNPGCAP